MPESAVRDGDLGARCPDQRSNSTTRGPDLTTLQEGKAWESPICVKG